MLPTPLGLLCNMSNGKTKGTIKIDVVISTDNIDFHELQMFELTPLPRHQLYCIAFGIMTKL